MNYSLAESPSGLVHLIQLRARGGATTSCGVEVDWMTWNRISNLDDKMFSLGKTARRALVELPTCDRCFGSQ